MLQASAMPLWGLASRHRGGRVKAKEAMARIDDQACVGLYSEATSGLVESRFGVIFQLVVTLLSYEHQEVSLMQRK
jgi:hypothetical protein